MRVYVGMDVHRKRSPGGAGGRARRPAPLPQPGHGSAELTAMLGRLEPGTPVAFEVAYG
jgi:hypothetical protein